MLLRKVLNRVEFLVEDHPHSNMLGSYTKVIVNKSIYLTRFFWQHLAYGSFEDAARLEWVDYPFSLKGLVQWSHSAHAWYTIENQSSIYAMKAYRFEPHEWVLEPLNCGMVFLDIGAHQGRYTLAAARKVGAEGLVIAIDPHPINVMTLIKNIELNAFENALVVPVACWDRDGLLTLSKEQFTSRSRVTTGSSSNESMTVPGMKVDSLVSHFGLDRVDGIKIDVEGVELAVLDGAQATIDQFHPFLFIEVHDTLPDLARWLRKHNYQVVRSMSEPGTPGYGWVIARSASAEVSG